MLERAQAKARDVSLDGRVTVQRCSFLHLEEVTGGPYDGVLSNLGGLNCVPHLRDVSRGLARSVRPGGVAVLVVMPPICLWELAMGMTRRLRRGGTVAHLEGRHFPVYYFGARRLARDFAPAFDVVDVSGLSVVTPTAESKGLAVRHPRVYSALARIDDVVSPLWPFSRWGDFSIVVLRRRA
jgi:hypothetical protein